MFVLVKTEREGERGTEREGCVNRASPSLSLTVVDRNVGSSRGDSEPSAHLQHVIPMWQRIDAVAGYDTCRLRTLLARSAVAPLRVTWPLSPAKRGACSVLTGANVC